MSFDSKMSHLTSVLCPFDPFKWVILDVGDYNPKGVIWIPCSSSHWLLERRVTNQLTFIMVSFVRFHWLLNAV